MGRRRTEDGMMLTGDQIEAFKRHCICGHDRASHYFDTVTRWSQKDKAFIDVKGVPMTCLCSGCACPVYRGPEGT